MKKVAFYTLGCKLNYSETSTMSRLMEVEGFRKVQFSDTPDIFIINTCSVTDNADKKCRKIVREAQDISPGAFIALVGCYAQLKPKEIAAIEGVDAVLGASEKFKLVELLGTFEKDKNTRVLTSEISHTNKFHASYSLNDRTRTFLKVQDGCNYNCSFCTIPLARGKSRSDSIENIIRNAEEIASAGVKEIVLTGVNTGDFGIQKGRRSERFIDLIKALDEIEGIVRFRISSLEPNLLTDEIIEFVADSKKFVPHFHLPLQSGSDDILKSMRRRYNSSLYIDRVSRIKQLMPNACIGVDVIVGFPGETEDEFLKTYNFINDLPVSYLHVFSYSERANTPAIEMTGSIPQEERNRRSKMLRILSEKKRRKFYEEHQGTEAVVLFENDIAKDKMHGFTDNYIRVSTKHDPLLINELKQLQLTSINSNGYFDIAEIEPVIV